MDSLDNNLPLFTAQNLFKEDPLGSLFFKKWLGDYFSSLEATYLEFGENAAKASPLSMKADQNRPKIKKIDINGVQTDTVVYDDSYHELEKLSFGKGIVAIKYDPDWMSKYSSVRHLLGFSLGYYFAQSEMSLYCPICMTDGVGRVLEKHLTKNPNDKVVSKALSHIASKNLNELWQGAMFITEKQGGSDVGANKVTAHKKNDQWCLNGEKWFCSNVDAKAILTLARMPEAPAGTEGLGLFLILREIPENNSATIEIQHLKDKLGVRSMPTGEVNLNNTRAYLLSGEGEGLKSMLEMVNLSRIYNSVASVAIMRRSILEALAFGHNRMAFGKNLVEQPLWRSAVSDLIAEHTGTMVLVFETISLLDKVDNGGSKQDRQLVRMLTAFSKAISAKLSVFCASEAMELIGGNAYIEDTILPRLLRDAQVLPIWEGATHILTLESLRSFHQQTHLLLFEKIEQVIESSKQIEGFLDHVSVLMERLDADKQLMKTLMSKNEDQQQVLSRECVEKLSRTFTLALLLDNASDTELREVCLAAFLRLTNRGYCIAPLSSNRSVELQATEEVLIRSAY
jgi:alkylation response protein AidB-like acyl-CoA dehydrogenase